MRGNWTSAGRMYLGREIPLFFLLFSNPHSSKSILDDDNINHPFSRSMGDEYLGKETSSPHPLYFGVQDSGLSATSNNTSFHYVLLDRVQQLF